MSRPTPRAWTIPPSWPGASPSARGRWRAVARAWCRRAPRAPACGGARPVPNSGQLARPPPFGALGRLLAEPAPTHPPPPGSPRPPHASGSPHTGCAPGAPRAHRGGTATRAGRRAAGPAPTVPGRRSSLAAAIPRTHVVGLSELIHYFEVHPTPSKARS